MFYNRKVSTAHLVLAAGPLAEVLNFLHHLITERLRQRREVKHVRAWLKYNVCCKQVGKKQYNNKNTSQHSRNLMHIVLLHKLYLISFIIVQCARKWSFYFKTKHKFANNIMIQKHVEINFTLAN